MRILIGLAVVMLWVPCGVAQNASCGRQSCVGEDFWVTFLCNDDDPANALLSVIATGSQQATITVTNPVTGWTQAAELEAGERVKIPLPTPPQYRRGSPTT